MKIDVKTYVLDTNVLLSDPNAIYSFGENNVVIPSVVLEELDSKKKLMDELGRNARFVSRQLDELRELNGLHNGVNLRNNGFLKVVLHKNDSHVFEVFLDNKNDNAIIAVAKELSESNPDTILVSRDVLVRVKADILSVKSEDYQHDKVVGEQDELYKGYSEIYVEDNLIDQFYKDKCILVPDDFSDLPDNHMFIMKSEISDKKSAIGKKIKDTVIPFKFYNGKNIESVFGLRHKNVQQMMALELLLDDSIPIVTLSGKAGTGKTLLSLAASLHKVLDEKVFNKILVARPLIALGKDIGYLPGEKNEKLRPWMQPIYDNLEFLFDCNTSEELEQTLDGYENIIEIEALTYVRGRSIPKNILIIDEAQNLTQHEVKTIVTRMGQNSKVILVGDPFQIDHPYLDMYSNGLTYVTEKFKDYSIAGHITFSRGERSELAELAANIL